MSIIYYILLIPWAVYSFFTLLSYSPAQKPVLYALLVFYIVSLVIYKKNKQYKLAKYLPLIAFLSLMFTFGGLL